MPLFSQRRNTDASGSSLRTRAPPPSREPTISLRRYGTEPVPKSNQKPNMEQYKYPVYRLHWDKLKAILQQWFPDTEFRELRVRRASVVSFSCVAAAVAALRRHSAIRAR